MELKINARFGLLVLMVMLIFMLLTEFGALHDVSMVIWIVWTLLGIILIALGV